MKTAAQIANDAKVRLQKEIISILRRGGPIMLSQNLKDIMDDPKLAKELESYDLHTPPRLSYLKKIAFPDYNREDVDAALEAGANLNDLFKIARGRAYIAKDSVGRYLNGKKGLKIMSCPKP